MVRLTLKKKCQIKLSVVYACFCRKLENIYVRDQNYTIYGQSHKPCNLTFFSKCIITYDFIN